MLEFDHIEPVARGGHATTANLRLRCRAHNQYEADRIFAAASWNGNAGARAGLLTAGHVNSAGAC
jgi:hypothetical protein